MSVLDETFVLSNEVAIPKVGFATWQMPSSAAAYEATLAALEAGYRHIDTARAGGDEDGVGRAVRDSGIPREQVFVTTKMPAGVERAMGGRLAFEQSVANLGLDYVDLYLVHLPRHPDAGERDPRAGVRDAWRALEDLYVHGATRAIGVRNFGIADLDAFVGRVDIAPQVNQIAFYVGNRQAPTTAWCQERGILVEGYSPPVTGPMVGEQAIARIAARHGRTSVQVSTRYLLEHGVLPLSRAVAPDQIRENADVDFELGAGEVAELDRLTRVAMNGLGRR